MTNSLLITSELIHFYFNFPYNSFIIGYSIKFQIIFIILMNQQYHHFFEFFYYLQNFNSKQIITLVFIFINPIIIAFTPITKIKQIIIIIDITLVIM